MQTAEVKSSTKSRPVYPPIEINEAVQQHVFIAEGKAFTLLEGLYQSCSREKSCWIAGLSELNEPDKNPKDCHFITPQSINGSFAKFLSDLPVSSNVYVAAKRESFLWDIHNLAVKSGMASEQVKMLEPLGNERRLFCTHCYTVTEDVTESPFECPGCHRLLLVRDHFSRIHSAYVGVQINAEDLNDVPETEELS